MIALLLSLLVLAPPVAGPEQELTPAIIGNAAGSQGAPAAATNGEVTLVAWGDSRRDQGDIFATRLDRAGNPLDPADRLLSSSTAGWRLDTVLWNGQSFVVIAHETQFRTLSLLFAPDGTPRREPRVIDDSLQLTIVPSSANVISAWSAAKRAHLIFLDDDGIPRRVTMLGESSVPAVAASDGNEIVAAMQVGTSVHVLRVHPDGSLLKDVTAGVLPMIPDAIATSGDRTLIAERKIISATGGTTRMVVSYFVVDRAGNVLVPLTVIDSMPMGIVPLSQGRSTATFDGTRFAVAWNTIDANGRGEVRMMRFTRDGAPIDTTPLVVDAALEMRDFGQMRPVFGSNLLLWPVSRSTLTSAYDLVTRPFTSVDDLAANAAARGVPRSAPSQHDAVFATGDDATFALWSETTAEPSLMGEIRPFYGPAGKRITIVPPAVGVTDFAVAASAGVFAVAWRDRDAAGFHIHMQLYDRTGRTLIGTPALVVSEPDLTSLLPQTPRSLALAGDGTQFFVAWVGGDMRVRGARVTTRGAVLDRTARPVSSVAWGRRSDLHVFARTNDFLVLWREDPAPAGAAASPHAPMRGTRISPNGDYVDAAFPIYVQSAGTGAAAEWNGSELLLAWRAGPCGYAQRFAADGTPIDAGAQLSCGVNAGRMPVAWDGQSWWIATPDATRGFRYGGSSFPITTEARGAQLIVTPAGLFVAYTRSSAPAGYVSRVFLRRVVDDAKQRAVRH